jgi:DNA-binding CsgD family transcriptional regulator
MQAFDSCTIDRKSYGSFLDRRFFQEIDKLEHKHIAIVPILIGSSVALFTVGLGSTPFKGELRQRITETIGHTVPAFINRFPEIKAIAEKTYLTDLERKVLTLLCKEFDITDLVHEIGLSEFTIRLLIQNASHKMQTKNSQQLIYKAIALGEISAPSSYQNMPHH